MTQRKISNTLLKIKACQKAGCNVEALLTNYHLNLDIIRFILINTNKTYAFENKKLKVIIRDFYNEISVNENLKALINKRSFKLVKTWLEKMDLFFKNLKLSTPPNTKALFAESEKIFLVLNISANKLLVRNKA